MSALPNPVELRAQAEAVGAYGADVRRGAHMADDGAAHRREMAQAAAYTAAAGFLAMAADQLEQAAAV